MSYNVLENILNHEYGVGALVANPTTVSWAYDLMKTLVGKEEAQEQLRCLNRVREQKGKIPCYIFEGV